MMSLSRYISRPWLSGLEGYIGIVEEGCDSGCLLRGSDFRGGDEPHLQGSCLISALVLVHGNGLLNWVLIV